MWGVGWGERGRLGRLGLLEPCGLDQGRQGYYWGVWVLHLWPAEATWGRAACCRCRVGMRGRVLVMMRWGRGGQG